MIGIFDSGLGGLTVAKEMLRQLPGCSLVYFGDTARTPYGSKSHEVVQRYALEDADFLFSKGAQVIVVACNTASAHGAEVLRQRLSVPVFEVITPAVHRAAAVTAGRVGVIGTRSTIGSGIYETKLKALAPELQVISAACPLFVPLVEEGWTARPETLLIAKEYLRPLRLAKIDTLILGCTHYPFLRSVIQEVIGHEVQLVDPAQDTVAEVTAFLKKNPSLQSAVQTGADHEFYVSDRTEQFAALARQWLEMDVTVQPVAVG